MQSILPTETTMAIRIFIYVTLFVHLINVTAGGDVITFNQDKQENNVDDDIEMLLEKEQFLYVVNSKTRKVAVTPSTRHTPVVNSSSAISQGTQQSLSTSPAQLTQTLGVNDVKDANVSRSKNSRSKGGGVGRPVLTWEDMSDMLVGEENNEELLMMQEMLLPVKEDMYQTLSRIRRQTVDSEGSTTFTINASITLDGNLTAQQNTPDSPANLALRDEIAEALTLFLRARFLGLNIYANVTRLSPGSIVVNFQIVYDDDITERQLAECLVDLDTRDNFKVGNNVRTVSFPRLENMTGGEEVLEPAICFLCTDYQSCTQREDQTYSCTVDDTKFYAFGTQQGDSTLASDDEFATAEINIESSITYDTGTVDTLWVSVNGLISLEEEFASFAPTRLPVKKTRDSSVDRKLLAVYWTDLDLLNTDTAKVYHHLYVKGSDNTARERAILARANADVVQYSQDHDSFDASCVVVVTWDGVPPWPAQSSSDERVTFQCVVISDGSATFTMYLFGTGAMGFNSALQREVEAGYGSVNLDTSRENYYTFDQVVGNTGQRGFWFFPIGNVVNSRALCRNWFNSQLPQLPLINRLNRIIPACPCSGFTALTSVFWIPSFLQASCYDILPWFGATGRRCCYRNNFAFENRPPRSGNLQLFTPYFFDLINHDLEDSTPKRWCCEESDLCDLYYIARPVRRCATRTFFRGFFFGDPHITTLDQRSYSFNGLGVYTLLEVCGETSENRTVNFKLQGRTCQATTSNGTMTNATVFCGLAVETTNGTGAEVQISADGNYLIIFVDTQDYTVRFRKIDNFTASDDQIYLQKNDGALRLSTPDNIGFTVSLVDQLLDFSVEIDASFRGITKGLLGNFNENRTDEFIFPNGTQLPDSATDRQLFQFGQSWEVSAVDSLFTITDGMNATANPDFEPIFLDEVDSATRDEAEQECGGSSNLPCVFDYIATRNTQLATNTKNAIINFEDTEAELSKEAPVISDPGRLEITRGEVAYVSVQISDPGNGSVSITALKNDNGNITFTQDNGTVLVYILQTNVREPIEFGLVATGSNNIQSEVRELDIVACSGCSGNGTCNFTQTDSVFGAFSYSIAKCECDTGYTGIDCELQVDGCADNPCGNGSFCKDLSPEEEAMQNFPYECVNCTAGFQPNANRSKCEDIDECQRNDSCDPNSECLNTYGSFKCSCTSGYRLSGQTKCLDINECVENSHKCSQICINTVGSYNCSCEEGFRLDIFGFNCTENPLEDPCAGLNNTCEYGCRNVSGVAECFCEIGRKVEPDGSCTDVDECQENLCSQLCTNSMGSYSCSCYAGFKLAVDGLSCDSCLDNQFGIECMETCNCRGRSVRCDPVKGCICQSQWQGSSCEEDVDECADPNICPSDQRCTNTNGSYTCTCPEGFNLVNGTCIDINECDKASINKCQQLCVNNPGSFACECQPGYNLLNNKCQDIDECSSGVSGCEHSCVNKEGSFNCECRPGFRLKDDRKSCEIVTNPCEHFADKICEHSCDLVGGVPTCFCRIGYVLASDNSTCLDVNECDAGNGCSDTCVNTEGSYNCSCPDGKKLLNDLRTCQVCDDYHWGPDCVNECACNPLGTTRCDPQHGCICATGWQGDKCQNDVDECNANSFPCPDFSRCINSAGSFRCTCQTGFEFTSNSTCSDIDECDTISPCHHICNNTIGSYICSCNEGFRSEGDECIDINECEVPALHLCDQRCRNTLGGFMCECNQGYVLNVTTRNTCYPEVTATACSANNTCLQFCYLSETGAETCGCQPGFEVNSADTSKCDDINECTGGSNPCVNGSCNNLMGGFQCECDNGTKLAEDQVTCQVCGDGFYGLNCGSECQCKETNTKLCDAISGRCECYTGWEGDRCETDINECRTTADNCGVNSTCRNSPGSFRCVCNIGYFPSQSNCLACDATHYGQDCAEECTCVALNTQDCDDISGTCTCKSGWNGTNCELDINECSFIPEYCPGPNDACVNLNGSAECRCDSGYERVKQSDNCTNINECPYTNLNTCADPKECNDTIGSFECVCKAGYLDDGNDGCTVNYQGYQVAITLAYPDTDIDPRVFDNTTVQFRQLAADIKKSVTDYGKTIIFQALLSVTVFRFRSGSVIADTTVLIDQLYSSNPPGDAAKLLHAVDNVGNLTVGGISVPVSLTSVAGSTSSATPTKCEIFNQLTTCPTDQTCQEEEGVPQCKPVSDDSNYELIIGLGVGIPLFFILTITVAFLVYMYVRKKKTPSDQMSSSPSHGGDAPFSSIFATQVATKGSWGAPHRVNMYAPDAYSETGTSQSSGNGRLPRAKVRGRSDFQDSPWFDSPQGATASGTPRDVAESRTAPTEGAGPDSNFSWEYMFRLLEPHKPFEIQRPNISSSPNPTFTPRSKTKRPDSMA